MTDGQNPLPNPALRIRAWVIIGILNRRKYIQTLYYFMYTYSANYYTSLNTHTIIYTSLYIMSHSPRPIHRHNSHTTAVSSPIIYTLHMATALKLQFTSTFAAVPPCRHTHQTCCIPSHSFSRTCTGAFDVVYYVYSQSYLRFHLNPSPFTVH